MSEQYGGAVYQYDGTFTADYPTFSNNGFKPSGTIVAVVRHLMLALAAVTLDRNPLRSVQSGGALYKYSGILVLNHATFATNMATYVRRDC